MGNCRVGRLERVGLRSVWRREREDFAPWLAEPGNLALLGDAAGLRLVAASLEQPVDRFRADIVCREAGSGSRVVIEVQLGPTDHRHLGQVLAYAAGFGASAVIWLAPKFHDLHREALDWMNRGATARYFGLEIEMWRIGESDPAPRFTVVAEPGAAAEPAPRPPCRVRPVRGAFGRAAPPPFDTRLRRYSG